MPRIARRLHRATSLFLVVAPLVAAASLGAQRAPATVRRPATTTGGSGVAIRSTGSRPVPVTPLRRLVGRYAIVRHNAAAVPALIYSDTANSEVLVSGVLDVRRDGAFTMRYVVRMRSLVDDTMIEDTTELSGKVTSTSAGLRLNVTANTGETLEEAWVLPAAAAAAGRMITVTFEDGNLEAVQFRRR